MISGKTRGKDVFHNTGASVLYLTVDEPVRYNSGTLVLPQIKNFSSRCHDVGRNIEDTLPDA